MTFFNNTKPPSFNATLALKWLIFNCLFLHLFNLRVHLIKTTVFHFNSIGSASRTLSKDYELKNSAELRRNRVFYCLFWQMSSKIHAFPKGSRLDDNVKPLCVYPLYQLIMFSSVWKLIYGHWFPFIVLRTLHTLGGFKKDHKRRWPLTLLIPGS